MKILITGGKSAVAFKLLKAFINDKVVLADYGDIPSFVTKTYQLISLGIKNEDSLAHSLLNNCLNEGVDAILPIHGFEIEALAKAEVLFNEFNIEVLLPKIIQLEQYYSSTQNNKAENWAIFKTGNLIFSTTDNKEIINNGKENKLTGAFYIDANYQFTLLTI